jgi:F0F1-type ATP synthase assembly protein I
VATLLYWWGPSIKAFIDRYFNACAWAFMILLVAGFLVLKVLR